MGNRGDISAGARGIFPQGHVFAAGSIGVRGTVGRGQAQVHKKTRGVSVPRMEASDKEGNGGARGGQGKWPDTGTLYGGCRLTGAGENLPVKIPRCGMARGKQ